MKHALSAFVFVLSLAAVPAWSAPKTPVTSVQAILAKPQDKAVVSFKATVVEDQGKNKFLVEDAGKRIEVKAGPDWYHTVSLPLKQPMIFHGEVHAKEKDGKRKLKVELYRVTRADGAVLSIREGDEKPWDDADKKAGKPPLRLDWQRKS